MKQNKRAFTLIELLVVVLIIGILAAIAISQYKNAVKKARVQEGMSMLHKLHQAHRLYYLANGAYTNDISRLDIPLPPEKVIKTEQEWVSYNLNPNEWYYYCYSMSSCIAAIGDPNIPNFQYNHSKDYMWCRFYDNKTEEARRFCKKQLKAIGSNWQTAMEIRLPN